MKTNYLLLDLRTSEWQDSADFVMALRPVAAHNSFFVTLSVAEEFHRQMVRLVDEAGLGDFVQIESAGRHEAQQGGSDGYLVESHAPGSNAAQASLLGKAFSRTAAT